MDQNHWFFILKYPNSIFNPWSGNNCFRNRLDNTFSSNLKSGLLCRFDLKSTWICRGRFHITIDRPVYVSLFLFYLNLIHILSKWNKNKIWLHKESHLRHAMGVVMLPTYGINICLFFWYFGNLFSLAPNQQNIFQKFKIVPLRSQNNLLLFWIILIWFLCYFKPSSL